MNEKINTLEKIGGLVSTLLLGKTKEIIIRTDERVNILIKTGDEMKKSIDDIKVSIATHGSEIGALKIHTSYGISKSPTTPNKKGEGLLKNSGFEKQYPIIKDRIFTLMDAMNLRTLYDYEVGAIAALEKLQNDPLIDPLKDYVVNHPDESLELVFKVASWLIRDDYNAYKKANRK